MDRSEIGRRIVLIYVVAVALVGLILFGMAGTLDYWQAWMYMGTLFIPALFVLAYFLHRDPEFLERRMRTKEKEARQKLVIKVATAAFIIGFLIPGLDQRFGWTQVPAEVSVGADALVFLGYALIFLVFRANSYAGRTVQVDKGQKVISTGPYAIVRHPMYVGTLAMYLATPIALGSLAAAPFFLVLVPAIVLRILNEEEVLRRDLPGYPEYCKKTRYRLVPLVW